MVRYLITGANGQIGSALVTALSRRHGAECVLATDIHDALRTGADTSIRYEKVDVTDPAALMRVADRHDIRVVYHLASLLSVSGELRPDQAWEVNVTGLKHVLDLARRNGYQVFWPSSIAVFGPETPRKGVPQRSLLDPTSIYGVTKVSGELLCRYYHRRFGLDVRSLRYPGLISYEAPPGGGATDYAVEIFYAAVDERPYSCFVRADTRLPMMYMPDAIRAALELMEAAADRITVRTSYNIGAMSFTAGELAETIRSRVPDFQVGFEPDARQEIADSWPDSVDDAAARGDWGWEADYDVDSLCDDMLAKLRANAEAELSERVRTE